MGTPLAAARIGLTAAVFLLALPVAPGPSAGAQSPLVRLVSTAPLTLAGSGFAPREKVALTVELRGVTHRAFITAGARGRFTHRFALERQRCEPLTLRARGSKGSTTGWALSAPDCSARI